MFPLIDPSRVRRLLCLGAHCDDIEIGAGGTVLRLHAACPGLEVRWVVFGAADPIRREEARAAAVAFAPRATVELLDFRDAFMQHDGVRLKEVFERLKAGFRPDLIFTHHDDDRHQDHRVISQLTWNTWRDHAILEYEIFKYDGDLGRPNAYVPLDAALVSRKIDLLRGCFASQAGKHWFDDETFRGLMRLRGAECNSPSRYAEAFYARKLVMGA